MGERQGATDMWDISSTKESEKPTSAETFRQILRLWRHHQGEEEMGSEGPAYAKAGLLEVTAEGVKELTHCGWDSGWE